MFGSCMPHQERPISSSLSSELKLAQKLGVQEQDGCTDFGDDMNQQYDLMFQVIACKDAQNPGNCGVLRPPLISVDEATVHAV